MHAWEGGSLGGAAKLAWHFTPYSCTLVQLGADLDRVLEYSRDKIFYKIFSHQLFLAVSLSLSRFDSHTALKSLSGYTLNG